MRKLLIPVLIVAMSLAGCAAQSPTVAHPGTFNTFDSTTYDSLLVTDSVIRSTKNDLAANKFPASIVVNVKTALNTLITVYNEADILYCGTPVAGTTAGTLSCSPTSYHGALAAGAAGTVTQAQVQDKLNAVSVATSALTSAKAGQ